MLLLSPPLHRCHVSVQQPGNDKERCFPPADRGQHTYQRHHVQRPLLLRYCNPHNPHYIKRITVFIFFKYISCPLNGTFWCFKPLPTHTHTKTHTHTHTYSTYTHTNTLTHTHAYVRTQTHKHTHKPTYIHTQTHTLISSSSSSVADGMMMTTQHTETSGMVTRHITKEVVQRSVVGGTTVTKNVERFYEAWGQYSFLFISKMAVRGPACMGRNVFVLFCHC